MRLLFRTSSDSVSLDPAKIRSQDGIKGVRILLVEAPAWKTVGRSRLDWESYQAVTKSGPKWRGRGKVD